MNLGQATLALDELVSNLTADQAAAIRQLLPVWFTDQADAATNQIRDGLTAAAASGDGYIAPATTSEHPAWVRLGALHTITAWWAGKNRSCLHDPHPMRPQPVASAAWTPGLIVCGHCAHLIRIPDGSPRDRTCDGCGHIAAGTANDPIHPFVVIVGVLTYSVGACNTCKYWEDPE